jgi:RimJ/RimL family protein N-acetyltransferase
MITEISNYGITLRRLTEDKIEMVRNWRNDPKIQKFMDFKDYITPDMQLSWFKKIDNENNYYFIILWQNKEVGLINVKNIDFINKTGETGIFIYDDDCLDSDVALRASLCRDDFIWDVLKLEKLYIHIMKDNIRAIKYNLLRGFYLDQGQENKIKQRYIITKMEAKNNKRMNQFKKIFNK